MRGHFSRFTSTPSRSRGQWCRVKVLVPALTRHCWPLSCSRGGVELLQPACSCCSVVGFIVRWQGGGAVAAVERRAQQVRGDHAGARGELLAGLAL